MAALDHDIDDVAGVDSEIAGWIGELGERRDAVRLVADVDIDIATRNLQNLSLEDFMPRRRREMAVILEKMLIFVGIDSRERRFGYSGCVPVLWR
jgi:hypothetical protein